MTPHDPDYQNPRTADAAVPAYAADDRSPQEIDRDLRATRARIDRHLDELTRRANPINLAKSLLGGSSKRGGAGAGGLGGTPGSDRSDDGDAADGGDGESTFAEVRDAVVDKARRNPIGLALIAGGLAWSLLVEDDRAVLGRAREGYHAARDRAAGAMGGDDENTIRRGRRVAVAGSAHPMMPSGRSTTGAYAVGGSGSSSSDDDGGPGVADRLKSAASAAGSRASSGADAAGNAASGFASSVGDAASGAAETVSDAASSIGGFLGSAASRLRTRGSSGVQAAGDTGSRVVGRGGDAGSRLVEAAKANPLLAAGVAAGLGLLLGSLVPETQAEDELFGEKADELKGSARERAQEAAEQAKQKAMDAGERVKEEALDAGSRLADAATDAKEDLVHAASEELQNASEKAQDAVDEAVPPPSETEGKIDAAADRADDAAAEASQKADDAVGGEKKD
ncbi:DUF3618 domain-containing protein [Phycisphaera mikurensis]|uniref:DUF3618 domain-containing protein n=1 Tax=Phycisphaera mikurensis (strain NBRC 102666 / KCTC 22515 / FYK2301M01) TaxID=1142394 RepID=I0IFD8_PHYMF|nr:DUF3618 domain-containing protein [Phycisphaera mikurensis]MBB6440631.1 ElaB/YqjD/DUF883 family membrane-anchored ribosome-binding protein [Phycisphaera mikurensis]BAM03976.1 hypothetical protein PSMK_18170 [Phycisphaera mikurensis NBRC 102666]